MSPTTPARFDITKLGATLEAVHERLAAVVIEHLPCADLMRRYDQPGALFFYLDPPCWGGETDYGPGVFGREDFGRLAEALRGIKGRFILSINDRPEIRDLFAGFAFEEASVHYTIARNASEGRAAELLVSSPA